MQFELTEIPHILEQAQKIVIVQADNPDGDSLGSALAMEQIVGALGKEPYLYCGVDMPVHLHYLPGWDRVYNELPKQFDLSIIVDTSSLSLLEQAGLHDVLSALRRKPCIVIDHHTQVENSIDFASLIVNRPAVATGEIIYDLAQHYDWPLSLEAKNAIAISILSDSLGLMTDATTAHSIRVIADLVDGGVQLPVLEQARRALTHKSPELTHYQGELLQRIEYHYDDRIATITIPWEEIEKYSPSYNPSILAIDDMRLTTNTAVAISFKIYKDGKITGKIRCNYGFPIAADLAAAFGGGGHPYASGFKIQDGRDIASVKTATIAKAHELLEELDHAVI